MLSKKIIIAAPNGLHARPVGELVRLVNTFPDTAVSLVTAAKTVKASSMLSILSLGLKQGSEVELTVDGGDESRVLQAVSDFIAEIKD